MASHIRWEKNIGRRFQLRELHVFFTVAGCGSMARAAAELGITQPSVSAVIAGLETSLGVRLFDRGPGGVELTPFGRALLSRVQAAFDELRLGVKDIEFLREPAAGEVNIGCPESISAGFLSGVIDLLSQRYPRVSLVVASIDTPTLDFRELGERKLDLVLARLATPDPKNLPADYTAEILFNDRLCIVAGRDSPWARRRKIDIAELANERWIISPSDSPGGSWMAEAFRMRGVKFPERCVTTYSVHIRNNLLATGRFIGTMPESALDWTAARFGLKRLSFELIAPPWPIAVVTLRNRILSPVANLFLDCARAVAKTANQGERPQP
ncbi:MAG: LysR family transcriptional regulator [Rhizobiales bacterium]|nr:LysR family transcriptional regulator [Hyphomicrobiales bacterium]